MKTTLPCGFECEMDEADAAILKMTIWKSKKDGTARTRYVKGIINGKLKSIHRVILGLDDPKIKVDHRDRNGLNNQRSNLRVATQSQNMANTDKLKSNTSGYKGVHKRVKGKSVSWRAEIMVNGKRHILGLRKNILEAVKLYDDAAVKYFGEFAKPNFPK